DLRFAYENLPVTTDERGRATKLAAGHFLAKLYLNRAQAAEFNGASSHLERLYKGNVATDLDSVILLTTEVIDAAGGASGLAPDYWDLFNPQISETSPHKEVLWAAQFDANLSLNGRFGNRSCNYHIGSYELESNVNRFGNIEYGRPFATYKP